MSTKDDIYTKHEKLEDEVERLRAALERACFIAEHLMDMTDQEAWRETGAIGPVGQYEGDFRQSLIWDEIQQLRAVRG